jgi:hypothetical protein
VSDRRDSVEEELQASLRAGAPKPPIHLLDHVLRLTEPLPQRSTGWRLRSSRLLALGGAAVILVAAFGAGTGLPERLGLLPAASGSAAPAAQPSGDPSATLSPSAAGVASPSVLPTASPTAVPTPLPTPSVYARWERIDLPHPAPDVYGGVIPTSVVAFRGGYVAVGFINRSCCADGDPALNDGVVWTSRNGREWEMLDGLPAFAHGMPQQLLTDGNRLLAYGTYAEPRSDGPATGRGSVWVSPDGRSWSRADLPLPLEVGMTANGYVGASSQPPPDDPAGSSVTFWASRDGLRWQQVAGPIEGYLASLAEGSGGTVVGVGVNVYREHDGGVRQEAVTWPSLDGEHWAAAQRTGDAGGMESVAATQGGFVAVGNVDFPLTNGGNGFGGAIWTSPDGFTWELREAPIALEETLHAVFSVGDAVIAVGDTYQDGLANAMIVISADGVTWRRVATQDAFSGQNNRIEDIIATDFGLIAVGSGWQGATNRPAVWFAAR